MWSGGTGQQEPVREEEAAEGSRRPVEDGEKAGFSQMMTSVQQGPRAHLPVGQHIVSTQNLALGLSRIEDSPSGNDITCRLFRMLIPHLLCCNLDLYKILRRFGDM